MAAMDSTLVRKVMLEPMTAFAGITFPERSTWLQKERSITLPLYQSPESGRSPTDLMAQSRTSAKSGHSQKCDRHHHAGDFNERARTCPCGFTFALTHLLMWKLVNCGLGTCHGRKNPLLSPCSATHIRTSESGLCPNRPRFAGPGLAQAALALACLRKLRRGRANRRAAVHRRGQVLGGPKKVACDHRCHPKLPPGWSPAALAGRLGPSGRQLPKTHWTSQVERQRQKRFLRGAA